MKKKLEKIYQDKYNELTQKNASAEDLLFIAGMCYILDAFDKEVKSK